MLTRLRTDLKIAMKSGNKKEKEVIQGLIGTYTLAEKEKRGPLTEGEGFKIVLTKIKQTEDAKKDFVKGGRQDLVEDAELEIAILSKYKPEKMLSEEEIVAITKQVIDSLPTDKCVMGNVMKAVKVQVEGLADMKMVSKVVNNVLG